MKHLCVGKMPLYMILPIDPLYLLFSCSALTSANLTSSLLYFLFLAFCFLLYFMLSVLALIFRFYILLYSSFISFILFISFCYYVYSLSCYYVYSLSLFSSVLLNYSTKQVIFKYTEPLSEYNPNIS